MMYTLDASGMTDAPGQPKLLWAAGTSGTKLRIQNRAPVTLRVVVALPAVNSVTPPPIIIDLPGGEGNFVDETWVDPTLAVSVISRGEVARFTAFRMA